MVVQLCKFRAYEFVSGLRCYIESNIGTTVTGQLVAFNLSDVAPLFVIAGVVMYQFSKTERKTCRCRDSRFRYLIYGA